MIRSDRNSNRISEHEQLRIKSEKQAQRDKKRWERMHDKTNWNAGFRKNDIDGQIQYKKKVLNQEREENFEYGKILCETVTKLQEEENEKIKQKKMKNVAYANELRSHTAQETDTFDLNDPKFLAKNQPPRINDIDEIPVSALQRFDGEDLNYNSRKAYQKIESKTNFDQQIREHQEASQKLIEADQQYANRVFQVNQMLNKKDEEKNISKQKRNKSYQKENIQISNKVKNSEKLKQNENEKLNKEEISYLQKSIFLTEEENATRRIDNSERYIPYNFKGFLPETTKEYHQQRLQQSQELETQKQIERTNEIQWANKMEAQRKHALKMEAKAKRNKSQKLQSHGKELYSQIEKQRQAEKNRNNLYKNEISPSFFEQFGTSHR